jgi:4-diphosphocytidyl-2-C-methyl-D-erythritol kinase
MSKRLRGWSPAKINLVLEVLGRRTDGYHEIDTILQTLEVAGAVDVELDAPVPGVFVNGPFATGVPADATNLAWRAAAALAERAGRTVDLLRITLTKGVPPAGGLGGGASDAATVLRLLQPVWGSSPIWGVAEEVIAASANAIGSDEAFFLLGGCARARGRGEVVDRLPPMSRRGVVLFVPQATIERKTARMFEALSSLPPDSGSVAEAFAKRPPESFSGLDVYNSFERVAFDVFPFLADLWQSLEARIAAPVRLAGAGPTLFWIGDPSETARVAAAAQGLACTVIETTTAASLWRP